MIYSFPANYINILAELFAEIDKLILKLVWKWWDRTVKIFLRKKNKDGRLKLPNFQTLNIYSKEIYVFLWLIHIVVQ